MIKNLLLFLIKLYRSFSPFMRLFLPLSFFCVRFPSCSNYMEESINKFGAIRGTWLGFIRIFSCLSCRAELHHG